MTDDVAVLACQGHELLTDEGRRHALHTADSSVRVRRDGCWGCALHTESTSGDPFGRDRRQPDETG